ncbi:MAG: GGDEF domain-containing protein [Actinomycetota bacterium]
MSLSTAELRDRISSARGLPSPPAITVKLIELCGDPETELVDVIEIVRHDPSLTARLMRLANSSVYGRRRRTENLRQAVTLLGLDTVLTASLTLSLTAGRNLSARRSESFRARRWNRSVHSAAIAEILSSFAPSVASDEAFLASLLQDIGVFVIDLLEPDVYEELDPDGTHEQLVAAERRGFGADHATVGSVLLEAWDLPPEIVDAVAASHRGPSNTVDLASVIGAAGILADGVSGDVDGSSAVDEVASILHIDRSQIEASCARLDVMLAELASILEADAPTREMVDVLAEEAILLRQVQAQVMASQLTEKVADWKNEAERLATENRLDALTGVSNRRHLDEQLDAEHAAATRYGHPLSVLFLDLDDFKAVNDHHGHDVGDAVLVHAADLLRATVRDEDIVGRYGGEEFLVLLPGTDQEGAGVLADRLIAAFNSTALELPDGSAHLQTTSIGVASLDHLGADASRASLVRAADMALYLAKAEGKNRMRHAVQPETSSPPSTAPVNTGTA